MRYLLYALPLALFAGLAVYLWQGLGKDPGALPSALLDRPAPTFALPPLAGRAPALPLATADLATGQPVVGNVLATRCVPCQAEHPFVTALAKEHGFTVHAINYKDKPEQAAAWLRRLGDPYTRIGADADGRAGIEFGIYGVPETFIIDGRGNVRHRHAGPLTPDLLQTTILPLLKALP
jgi:cytochrome c biogenesis protein CcmG/thiol:disulfide interchange protein DsbE